MFIKKKKNRSGSVSIVIGEKNKGEYKELVTIGIAKDESEIAPLVEKGKIWIDKEQERRQTPVFRMRYPK